VGGLLRTSRPVDWTAPPVDRLTLCRVVDGAEVLDDAVVAVTRRPDGSAWVDVNLHGGPRIVQRVLMALSRFGIQIVHPGELPGGVWPARDPLERAALALLPQARTRAVAAWLARVPGLLRNELQAIEAALTAGAVGTARQMLTRLLERSRPGAFLLAGLRVVLTGEPNSGKSTLANALAGEERVLVSPVPGTTRDWVELPAAIGGVPLTLVDTAGLRATDDPLEQESIRRARAQLERADVVLHVIDRSAPRGAGLLPASSRPGPTVADSRSGQDEHTAARKRLWVWSKADLPAHSDHASDLERLNEDAVVLSARTGEGLEMLRRRIVERAGLAEWSPEAAWLFTEEQSEQCRRALSALDAAPLKVHECRERIQKLFRLDPAAPSGG
ncbi:MAG: 50S ribosome-binding GTPase, partial [Phycisphaerae bacterium]|jgi:tRNA modification GTPase